MNDKKIKAVNKSFIKSNLPIIKEKLIKQNITLKDPIGIGSYGIAYNTNDPKKVLKITTDLNEAKTSSKIIGKKYSNIVKIYKVFTYSTLPKIYFILQEKLKPLSPEEIEILEDFGMININTKIIDKMLNALNEFKASKNIEDFLIKYTKYSYFSDIGSKLVAVFNILKKKGFFKNYILPSAYFLLELKKGYGVSIFEDDIEDIIYFFTSKNILNNFLESVYGLYINGIEYTDTHLGNLMKDSKGIFKWIDLGSGSKAPGKENIEKINASKKIRAASKFIIDMYLPEIKRKLRKQRIELKNIIAEGSFGIAYNTNDSKKVLKITTDLDEAKTSSKIIGKNLKNVVNIYRVFSFTAINDIYFILQEKLLPLSTKDLEIFDDVSNRLPKTEDINKMMNAYNEYLSIGNMKDFVKKNCFISGKDQKIADIYESLGGKSFEKKHFLVVAFFCWGIVRGTNPLLFSNKDKDYALSFYKNPALEGALKGIYEMKKKGITYTDNHSKNFLKDSKGNYKWIDLGYGSKAPGNAVIEKITALLKNVRI